MSALAVVCCVFFTMLLPQGEAEMLIHSQETLTNNGLLYPPGSTVMAVLDPANSLPNLASNVDVNVVLDCSQVEQAMASALSSRTQPRITWERLTPAPPVILSSANLNSLGISIQGEHGKYLNISRTIRSTGAVQGVAGIYSCKACAGTNCMRSSISLSVAVGLPAIEEGSNNDVGKAAMFSVKFRIGTDICISANPSHPSGVQVNTGEVSPTEADIMGISLVCHDQHPLVPAFTRWYFNGTLIVDRGIHTANTALCRIPYDVEECMVWIEDYEYVDFGFINSENMHMFIGNYTCEKYQFQTGYTASSTTSVTYCGTSDAS